MIQDVRGNIRVRDSQFLVGVGDSEPSVPRGGHALGGRVVIREGEGLQGENREAGSEDEPSDEDDGAENDEDGGEDEEEATGKGSTRVPSRQRLLVIGVRIGVWILVRVSSGGGGGGGRGWRTIRSASVNVGNRVTGDGP